MTTHWKRDLLLGGIGYPALEILCRGRSHWTMAVAGGFSLCMLRRINHKHRHRPLLWQAMRGGLSITAVEYAIGRVFNRKHRIWDYRKMPLNLRGQICLPYTLFWCIISGAALTLMRKE